uniref:Ribosome binding factor A n=1 Tax=Leptobrachium leishanense TaxID=445787 RepID=A0A8C5MH31_9ANUR
MALCPAAAPGLLRACGWGCMRAVVPACSLLGGPEWRRELHVSPAVSAKSLLSKFASKTKKKFWYDSPTLGTQFAKKPDSLLGLMKVQKKQRREDSIHMQTLNSILHKALSDLLSTPEVSEDVYNLNLELSKVSLAVDFSACRAYWIASGNVETDNCVEKVLMRYAPHFRHLLLTRQVLGGVPPIVFVRDKENAVIQEVDRLLAIADFGEDYNRSATHGEFREWEHTSAKRSDSSSKVPSPPDSNLFGIDHGDLNRQIQDYKNRIKDGVKEDIIGLSQRHQEQLAEIRRQKITKKKMRKRKLRLDDNDIAPQNYLMDGYDDSEEFPSEYLEFEDEVVFDQLDEREEEQRTNPKGGS